MTKLAKEYMKEMGIGNTQYIIVRHHNTENPHMHIVYNRINNDLKLISVNNDYKSNIKVCKKLKDKYRLTYGEGKKKVKREKLNNPDKVKYRIYDAIKAVLPYCKTPNELKSLLRQAGIETYFKLQRTTGEIQGISFSYKDISFKGSQVDRKLSFGNLKKEFEKTKELQEKQTKKTQLQSTTKPEKEDTFIVGGIKLTPGQVKILKNGEAIFLENMRKKDGSELSAYLFFDDQMERPFYSTRDPESFIRHGKYEMRLMDKIRLEAGCVTHAKVRWYGGGYAYPYLWKENNEYKESWGDLRILKTQKIENKAKQHIIPKKNGGRKL